MPTKNNIPKLKGIISDIRILQLLNNGYDVKRVKLPNGDIQIMKRKRTDNKMGKLH